MLKQEPKEADLRGVQTANKRDDGDSDDDWVVDIQSPNDKKIMEVVGLEDSSGDEGFVHV